VEFLIYGSPELAGPLEEADGDKDLAAHFSGAVEEAGGKIQHASQKFGTIVVELPDAAAGDFRAVLASDPQFAVHVTKVEELQYQTRFNLNAAFTEAANNNPSDLALKPLNDVLERYNASMKNQYQAFADAVDSMAIEIPQMADQIVDAVSRVKAAIAADDVGAEMKAMQEFNELAPAFYERTSLHGWTKATIDKPGKKELYSSRFTAYADGGKEVYSKASAVGLENELRALMASGMVTKVNRFNMDPAQNPQAGPMFR
jgi:hypothetical protein